MRNLQNAIFGLLCAAAVATASDVHELKKDTFDGFVKENELVLAECKLETHGSSLGWGLTWLSLRPLVRTLQGPRPRIRRSRNDAKGEEHTVGQG